MDYSLKDVAGRIKDLREAKGYTQSELAKLTGVSLEDYQLLEKGDTDFSFTFIYKCAKAYRKLKALSALMINVCRDAVKIILQKSCSFAVFMV